MQQWLGRLTEIELQAEAPAAAADYWAGLFDAEREGDDIVLDAGTRIAVRSGEGPALAQTVLAASDELLAALPADEHPDGGRAFADADGWSTRAVPAEPRAGLPAGPMLGHLTFRSPDPARQQAFYEGLGFRLSDALGDIFSWLRCSPIHHTVAYARAPEPGIHHLAIELPDRGALISAADRLAERGERVEFGPGRHIVGGNLFLYFRDRYGLRWELFTELHRIEDPDYEPHAFTAEDRARSINVWGVMPPESFLHEAGGPGPAVTASAARR
jgi:catechol 2,3-dioxygenase-like lactoylglutathione lyase family enzyme